MKKEFSCIIPAHNEEKTITKVIEAALRAKKNGLLFDIIVVSDGSSDKTVEVSRKAGADLVLDLAENIGKCGAVLEGVKRAKKENILLLDADLIGINSNHIEKILQPIIREEAAMVVGFFDDDEIQNMLPQLSGQRALKKEIFNELLEKQKFEKGVHNLEVLLNRAVKKREEETLFVPLSNITHLKKSQKYTFEKTVKQKIKIPLGLLLLYRTYLILILIVFGAYLAYVFFWSPTKVSVLALNKNIVPLKNDKILVVVSHPDDEVIGAGGYIYQAVSAGASVYVVYVTNGDGNVWSAKTLTKNLISDSSDFIKEGKARMDEGKKAMKKLGVSEDNIYFLGFPDRILGKLLKENWDDSIKSIYTDRNTNPYTGTYREGQPYTGSELEQELIELITLIRPTKVVTHSSFDENSDHKAVYRFTKMSLAQVEGRELIEPSFFTFLVHWNTAEFPHPLRLEKSEKLYPPIELANSCRWVGYELGPTAIVKKEEAMKVFDTQEKSPYLYLLMQAFIRQNELFCEK